ncbi:MAG TPA: hypothetical protein VJ797_04745, partial [Burkholderiales bacterium]|nr:hypothetical protein [Burkholderiales bacterium]
MTLWIRALLVLLAVACALPAAAETTPIILLRSDTTAAFFRANGGDYERLLQPWRDLLARHRISASEQRAAELAGERGVLILASSVALSEPERQAIRA